MPETDIVQLSRSELKAIVKEVFDEQLGALSYHVGMISSLGDGSLEMGTEVIRKNHEWLSDQRERAKKISSAVLLIVISSVIGGMLLAFWEGVKYLLTKAG